MSKVRIYDLAKELKLDNKKVIEEVRRFGYDVSVPSNSVPPDIAEKVKSKYFPQKPQTAERRVKLVKHRSEDGGNVVELDSKESNNEVRASMPKLVKQTPSVIKTSSNVVSQITPNVATPIIKVLPKDTLVVEPQNSQNEKPMLNTQSAATLVREVEDIPKQRIIKIDAPITKIEEPIAATKVASPDLVMETPEIKPQKETLVEIPVAVQSSTTVIETNTEIKEEVVKVEVKPEKVVTPAVELKPDVKEDIVVNNQTKVVVIEQNKPVAKVELKVEPPKKEIKTEIKPLVVEQKSASQTATATGNLPKVKPIDVSANNLVKTHIVPLQPVVNPNTGNVNRGQDNFNRRPHHQQNQQGNYQQNQQNRPQNRPQSFQNNTGQNRPQNRPHHQQNQQGNYQQNQQNQQFQQRPHHQQNQQGNYQQNQQNQQFQQQRPQQNQNVGQRPQQPQQQRPPGKGLTQVLHRVTATPEVDMDAQRTTYIPPPDGRKKSRRAVVNTRPVVAHGKKDSREMREKLPNLQPPPTSAIVPKVIVPKELKPIKLVEGTTVKELAEKLEVKPKDVVALLLSKGVMATINQTLNSEVVREIGHDFGYEISFVDFEEMTTDIEFEEIVSRGEALETRAPVVTVMGHVDHGKTSLLDAIRKTRVAEGEAGGITQHIGAYSVLVPDPDNPEEKRRVVFLDTPGHEAFTMMRARGAKVTDIVVLVVAADDGVMPQTIEAIEHAKAAGVPIVVAINKVDKPQAQPDRVKQALSDYGLVWDGWGGETVMVEVSAKHRINLNGLLEMILLSADILDLKADSQRIGMGVVLEAKLDKGRGVVSTVLVQNGTLKVGDPVIAGMFFGRVRAMFDENGKPIQTAGPCTPVEVLGLQGIPAAGDQFQVVTDVAKAQQITLLRQSKKRMLELSRSSAQKLEDLFSAVQTGKLKELLVILKTDVQGSVEVLKDTLQKLSTDKVKVRVIRSGVGAITESDVLLASASNDMAHTAVIIGFNVRPEQRAEEIARLENVDVRLHSIIYKVEEEIRNAMIGMLEATIKEVPLGKAEIRQIIKIPKAGNIAGVMVIDGIIKRTAKLRLIRDGVLIHEGQLSSLRRFKDDVAEVKQGFECGIGIEKYSDIKIGDILEIYTTEKVTPTAL
jgi:translation initiation factor IF-2